MLAISGIRYTINLKERNKLSKISDSGPGIDKEILPRLFDKFITGSPSGTGLGLYICKNIIEAHGGNIWAKNNDENKGATFAFTLPIVTQKLVQL